MKLVVPADHTADTLSWIVRDDRSLTWAEVAAMHGVAEIEPLGSEWCVDHGVDGLGFVDPAPPVEPVLAPDVRAELLARIDAAATLDEVKQVVADALAAGAL